MNSSSATPLLTLIDVLQRRACPASGTHDKRAFTYLNDGEQVSGTLSFAELDRQARSLAAHLMQATQPGDRVLLVFPPGLDYIVAFFGCVYAGVVAVPALPPANARTLPRLQLIAADATPRLALAPAAIAARMADGGGPLGALAWLAVDGLEDRSAHWCAPAVTAASIVFLQYTSGSTAEPKGVMVSHRNLLANSALSMTVYGLVAEDVLVSWLPPHHDFGLIGSIVLPVFGACHSVQFPPSVFLMRPHRWLQLISDYRARMTGAPNFAYELCASKVTEQQKQGLDLARLDIAVNGAERVRPRTLQRFADAFAGCGFRPCAFTPAYGLAESTLLVSADMRRAGSAGPAALSLSKAALAQDRIAPGADGPDALLLVSNGLVDDGAHRTAIVDHASGVELGPDRVGEIWISGPSVADGYWARPEHSAQAFGARLAGSERTWLRTGDLGFIHAGALYVAGRLKEMMIFSGRNVYPQDVEASVEALDPAFRANGCAAFALEDEGGARLVVIQELESRRQPQLACLVAHLRTALAEQHELFDLAGVVLVKAGHLPRTSSGKIQRARCRQLYLEGAFEAVWRWEHADERETGRFVEPASPVEQALAGIWCALLGLERVSADDDFFAAGGHSLAAAQLLSRVRLEFGVELPLRAVFEAPTVAALASRIAAAREEAGRAPLPALVAGARPACAPLSFAQQRLWFLDRLDHAAGAAYHIPGALRLSGRLDKAALRAALDRIVARHESLRTTFVAADGGALQHIAAPDCGFSLAGHDLGHLPGHERESAAERIVAEEAAAPFDLAAGPLIRGRLLRLAEDQHILLVTQHHIVSDGWSLGVLVGELSALYGAFSQGLADPLAPLAIQYADYAAWQRQALQGEALQAQARYWKAQLAGAPALLELPTDRARPPVQSHAGAKVEFTLPAELAAGLRRLGQAHGATLFMTLLCGWATLLARLSGQDDVVIGTPFANRPRAELEPLIGFFVNTLALRVRLEGEPSVGALLEQVRDTTLAAHAHQDLPFEQVVEALNPPRSLAHSPLFQAVLTLNNTPGDSAPDLPGLALARLPSPQASTQFDLSLALTEHGAAIEATIEYARDLFDHASIARMAGQYLTLLAAMTAAPHQAVGALPLLSAAERAQLLEEFNRTGAAYARDQLVHCLFEARAASAPDAVALVFEDLHLSYGELNVRANGLAQRLLALGVAPGDRVALCVRRGLDMVIGLLGILKAGAAYVPLDPAYPSDRIAYMLEDSAPAAVLTQSALRAGLPVAAGIPVLLLDGSDQPRSEHNPDPRALGVTAEHLAYVIYTSGSTGLPKGVMVQHRPVINLIEWVNRRFAVGSGDYLLFTTSVCFDLSVYDIFGMLAAGGRVRIASQDDIGDPAQLVAILRRDGITFWDSAPAVFQLLRPFLGDGAPATALRLAFFSGDWIPLDLPDAVRGAFPACEVVSLGGATEATVWSNFYPVGQVNPAWASIPYGKPIQNARYYVLDRHRAPCPIGVAGDLYIGGECTSAGYFGRAQLTAERFVADPFAAQAGARMYLTGDRARYGADGNLEFLGRLDSQVKIRGFRIELGEIEARLNACAGVRAAVVLAREDQPGDRRLVAYLVAHAGSQLAPAALRAQLGSALPEYMLPAAFVTLDAFPLTSNGKLDRAALPAPGSDAVPTRAHEAPQGATERAIAALWQQLLGLERVGRKDHFFELGGHSLLAVQFIARLRQRLGVEIALRELFANPELDRLARLVAGAAGVAPDAIAPQDRAAPLPLSFAQQRLWFIDRLDHAAGAAYHIPAALRLSGRLRVPALRAALDRIVARHESLRTTFVAAADGAALQRIAAADCGFSLAERDLGALAGHEQESALARIAADEAAAPFDLAAGPLIRGQLLRLADERHVLLVTQHHIVSDGWSTGVLVREVSALYGAFSQGLPDPLAPLAIQYADYAAWQRQALQGEPLQAQAAYWRRQLAGAPALLELPSDRARPPVQSHAGAKVDFTLPAELAAGLRRLGQAHGATLFMTLLCGWAIVLARLSGQEDIVIGTPFANRRRAELEPLIGFFVNTLALRVRLEGEPSVAALLEQVRDTTLAAHAHQDLPFEQVVEALNPSRSMAHSPVFQVLLSLDNTPGDSELRLPGLTMAPLAAEHATTHFDLSLSLAESGAALHASLEYASDLFERTSAERIAAQFATVLGAMVADPGRPCGRVPLLTPEERQQLLAAVNQTDTPYPQDQLVHRLFEAQAARRPDAPALEFEGRTLSYAALNRRANRIAHSLIELGAGPDQRIALCMERSADMVAAMLGILKAGAAYVPLDPTYPAERLAYLLADSGARALITAPSLLARLPAGAVALPVLLLDDAALGPRDGNPDVPGLTSRHLAQVIYTSGSTGLPKGVMIEHRSVLRLVIDNGFARIDSDACVAHCANPAFDASTWEIWAPLLHGARLLVLPPATVLDPAAFALALERGAVSCLFLTTGLFNQYAAPLAHAFGRLDYLLFGGEQADPRSVARLLAQCPPAHLVNCYGPTECTMVATAYLARAADDALALPIGRPIANTRVYLLDRNLEPVPPGATGEIWIGGPGVARGYLNRPELTAERFLPDPFDPAPQARMYKSGDLARWNAGGQLVYLGRNDLQVKIRGYRIEPGEIEARLADCAGVRDARVIVREDQPGERRLVAYLVCEDGREPGVAALRAALAAVLPAHMVPAAFVSLPALPLTSSGKLDRHALPAPGIDAVLARGYEAPQGEAETAIALAWQELLGIAQVGRQDHFFDLGGHSLLAVRLMARLREQFGIEMPLRVLFEHPVLSRFAEQVVALQIALYAQDEIHALERELGSLTEEELLAILAEGQAHEQ